MKSIEKRARTVEDAVAAAVAALGVRREDCTVCVLEEPAKGLLGRIGSKGALVRVTAVESKAEVGLGLLRQVLSQMGIDGTVTMVVGDERVHYDIEGPGVGALIGHRGQTLEALQHVANLAASRGSQDRRRLIVDVAGYRRQREEKLLAMVQRLAERVSRTGESVELEAMEAHERKVVHVALQDHPAVTTYSEGEEPYRRVIISSRAR